MPTETENSTLISGLGGTARDFMSEVISSSLSRVAAEARPPRGPALDPTRFTPLRIREVHNVSPDTKAFDVLLPHEDDLSGLVTSAFIMVKGADDEARPYTPVSPTDQRGWLRLVIKAYPGGAVSSHLHTLRSGDYMLVKGPFFKLKYVSNQYKHIGMIAGGTGVTPMLQIIKEIIKNPGDSTTAHLLFQSRSENDINILREEIDDIVARHSNISVTYILSQPSAAWKGLRGRLDAALLAETMPPPSEQSPPLLYVCGPPGMLEAVAGSKAADKSQGELTGLLKDAGYSAGSVFKV